MCGQWPNPGLRRILESFRVKLILLPGSDLMVEKQNELLALLKRLQAQVQETPNLDPQTAEQIQRIVREIESSLPGPNQSVSEEEPSLADRLKETALEFEASHPTLSGTVGGIADALAQMGI